MNKAWLSALALVFAQLSLAQYTIFAAETNAGSMGGDTSQYGGVQRWDFASVGGAATQGTGLDKSVLHDPAGLLFRDDQLLVGNRWGNTIGQGSIQAFDFDGTNLTGGATIAQQSSANYQGFCGFYIAPNTDLFVTTVSAGTRRYRDNGSGYVDIDGTANAQVRDVWVSPDGKKMIESGVGSALHVHDLTDGSIGSATDFTVTGANVIHQMAYKNGSLFMGSFNTNEVYRVDLDSDFNPVSSTKVADVAGAIGVTFSPDGQEMLVSSHTGNMISRFLKNGSSWDANGSFDTGHNMGYLATVPEPTSMTLLGLGALALVRRRRSK